MSSIKTSKLLSVLSLIIFLASLSAYAQIPVNKPVWSTLDPVADLAVSGDGSIVVISNYTSLKVFNGSGHLLWQYKPAGSRSITAVDISRDGNAIVAATSDGVLYFWRNPASLSGEPDPDWSSGEPGGYIGPNALAISCDGNHVVAVGTGPGIYYWNNTMSASGIGVATTWFNMTSVDQLEYVDISCDGNVIVTAGTMSSPSEAWMFYIEDATLKSGNIDVDLAIRIGVAPSVELTGLALSDDGKYAVVSYYNSDHGWSLYYYNFTAAPYSYWETEYGFTNMISSVDISSSGDIVVSTVNNQLLGPFSLTGYQPNNFAYIESNISFYHVPSNIPNGTILWPDTNITINDLLGTVSLSCNGSIAVAGNASGQAVYTSTIAGYLLWFDNSSSRISDHVKVACNGKVAVTGGSEVDSLHYYRIGLQRVNRSLPIVGGESYIEHSHTILSGLILPIYVALVILGILLYTTIRRQ